MLNSEWTEERCAFGVKALLLITRETGWLNCNTYLINLALFSSCEILMNIHTSHVYICEIKFSLNYLAPLIRAEQQCLQWKYCFRLKISHCYSLIIWKLSKQQPAAGTQKIGNISSYENHRLVLKACHSVIREAGDGRRVVPASRLPCTKQQEVQRQQVCTHALWVS